MILIQGKIGREDVRTIAHLTSRNLSSLPKKNSSSERPHLLSNVSEVSSNFFRKTSLNEGCQFFHDRVGKVEMRDVSDKFYIGKRSQTWLFTRAKVESFLLRLKREENKSYPFLLLGSQSLFSGQAEGVNIYHPILAAINEVAPKLFQCLYDSAQNGGFYTGKSETDFYYEICEVIVTISNTLHDSNTESRLKYLKDEDVHLLENNYSYKDLVQLILEEDERCDLLQQHSCFTWARKQLQTLDIVIQKSSLDSIIAITRLHLRYQRNEVVFENRLEASPDRCVEISSWIGSEDVPQALKGRFVTYDKNRNKTPETLKNTKEAIKNEAIGLGVTAMSGTMATYMFGVVAVASAPVVAIPVIGVGLVLAGTTGWMVKDSIKSLIGLSKKKKTIESLMNSENKKVTTAQLLNSTLPPDVTSKLNSYPYIPRTNASEDRSIEKKDFADRFVLN